ncbi:Peptidase A1 [Cinnamomum micranthum f. kanehirae]|uniref:Peptidase A1 n=1 Tax=Cinnamomum micranthum f. kanehirae TaxID=337451 RepID=A0A3S3Q9B1_9MAGN|nr:Peptidase A1 [Cinnamomum micranthum f. kanehirae]
MAASATLFPIATFFFLLNLPNSLDAAGFSVDLIHRDSPKSPFYNHSESLFDRVSRAIHRSNSHVNYFIPSTSVATRKDVFSTCLPCKSCYKQLVPLFDPSKSSTRKEISCDSSICVNISHDCTSNEYMYSYGDYVTYTNGVLARETFMMNSSDSASGRLSIPNITFGCGQDNHGTFFGEAAGVVGLGKGPFSLISLN